MPSWLLGWILVSCGSWVTQVQAETVGTIESGDGMVDCEVHYVDFNQTTEGMAALLAAMDAAGVEVACVMGIPLQKSWQAAAPERPKAYEADDGRVYYYSATDVLLARAVLALPTEQQRRLRPLISGFNPVDRNAVAHIERMLEWYPGLWRGIGEVLTRHDTLSHLLEGEVPRANHPALVPVYRLAAERNLPVLLHSNIASVRRSKTMTYLHELTETLDAHPDTRFIWAHAGVSANMERRWHIDDLHQRVEVLLQQYDNLSILLSWTLASHYLRQPDGRIDPDWLALIERYPQRFILGSDLVGRFGKLEKALEPARLLLQNLTPPSRAKVARDNALELFGRD